MVFGRSIIGRGHFRYRSLKRVTLPAIEPVSLAEAKAHMRIDAGFTEDDVYVQSLISAARTHVESVADRTLIRSQWQMKFDFFPSWDVELPKPPIMNDTVVVTYVPSDGVYSPVAFTNFRTDRDSTPAVIRPQWNSNWPSTRGAENDITVTYWAGYGSATTDVPAPARHAILMLAAHWYRVRESVVDGGMAPVPQAIEYLIGAINWGQYR